MRRIDDPLALLEIFQVLFRFEQIRSQSAILLVVELLDPLSSAHFEALVLIELGRPVDGPRRPIGVRAGQFYLDNTR